MLRKISEREEIWVDPAEVVALVGTHTNRTQIWLRGQAEYSFVVLDPPPEVLKRLTY